MRKNGFLTFCCSFFPGFGQMYQGYMKRGFSLLSWFCIFLFLAITLNVGALSIFMLVIWAVAFFDTFNIRALSDAQRAAFADDFIPSSGWMRNFFSGKVSMQGKGGKIVGWGCIGFGILVLYNSLLRPLLLRLVSDYSSPFYDLLYKLPGLVIAIGVILLGLWLLSKNKQVPQHDDIDQPYGGESHA